MGTIHCIMLGRETESKVINGIHVHPIVQLQWQGALLASVCNQNHIRILNTYHNKGKLRKILKSAQSYDLL